MYIIDKEIKLSAKNVIKKGGLKYR